MWGYLLFFFFYFTVCGRILAMTRDQQPKGDRAGFKHYKYQGVPKKGGFGNKYAWGNPMEDIKAVEKGETEKIEKEEAEIIEEENRERDERDPPLQKS
jgi:hypothetical protein